MKKLSLIIATLLLGSASVFALEFTLEDAQKTFRLRGPEGEAFKAAVKAESMFEELVKDAVATGKDVVEQADLLNLQSRAIYYVADHSQDNEAKKAGHFKGTELSRKAAKLLHEEGQPTKPLKPEYSRPLAQSYYWLGANFGKWGLANGILNSLRQWPELRGYMENIETLGEKDVESYGANRILARAYFKLPFPLGDKSKALELLEEAYENTLEYDGGISNYSTTVLYYAEVLIAKGQSEKAKDILTKFVDKGKSEESLKEYNEDRIPETVEEIAEAKKILEKL